eukprot:TRINITY_DN100447_c0_g1_i1.p1 TRINITY_DN100447_c0_g1~~TRINITY_DN100447_c0_g1_i1.p1  ORF type:complete len:954 (-),score=182.31 TRINITY_DN100447_c0_g1_i1:8-2869(-)
MLSFQGDPAQLQAQIRNILADERMLAFICDHSFRVYDTEGQGALTFPGVAPMIQNLLKAMGRPTSSDVTHAVWRKYCDPDMHNMSVERFGCFLRGFFQEYLDVCEENERRARSRVSVHRPPVDAYVPPRESAAMPAAVPPPEPPAPRREEPPQPTVAGYPAQVAPQSAAVVPSMVSGGSSPSRPPRESAVTTSRPKEEALPQQPPAKPAAPPMRVMQDARSSPPPPKRGDITKAAAPKWQSQGVPAKAVAQPTAPQPTPAPSADEAMEMAMMLNGAPVVSPTAASLPAPPEDALADAYRRLPAEANSFCEAARSGEPVRATDCHQGHKTVLTSLQAALRTVYELVAALPPGALFEDPEFGPTPADPSGATALQRGDHFPEDVAAELPKGGVKWLRPGDTKFSGAASFAGEHAATIPGAFADSWFLGALGVLAVQEPAIFGAGAPSHVAGTQEPLGIYPRLLWDPALRQRGLYCFRFNKQGQWLYVVIDDRLPHSASGEPCSARALGPDGKASLLFAPLIEKAYAKLHGGYSALPIGFVDDALEDLTSWPTEKLPLSKYLMARNRKAKDPRELWDTLLEDLKAGSTLVCSRMDGNAAPDASIESADAFVHVDAAAIGMQPDSGSGRINTGILRNSAYAVLLLREVTTSRGEVVQVLRLRDVSGGSTTWRGRWNDYAAEWSNEAAVARSVQIVAGSRFLVPCGKLASDSSETKRPQQPLWPGERPVNGPSDGTFVIRFDDWLQVFSHVLISRPMALSAGWTLSCLDGRWSQASCGGTPIPIRVPDGIAPPQWEQMRDEWVSMRAPLWGRNPQCRLILDGEGTVDVCVSLLQQDARLTPGSPFPFEDRLLELFLCISKLDDENQRLDAFDKNRIVKPGGVSLLSRRRAVQLRTRLAAPGAYALVPSTWEAELPAEFRESASFRLLVRARCPPGALRVEAPADEGWVTLEARQGSLA